MNSMRNVKYLSAMLAIASLAAFGCSKEEKKAGDKQPAQPGQPATPGAAAPASPGAKTAFAIFPRDTNMLLGINVSQISSSNLYKQFVEPQIKAQADKEFAEFKAECGFDPFTTIKEVVIGMVMDKDMEPQEDRVLVVVKGLTRKQLSECSEKMAKKEDKKIEVNQEGNFTKLVNDGETTWIAWLDDATMVAGPKMDKAALEQRIGGKEGVDTDKDMMDLLANTDQKAGIWLTMKKPDGAEAPSENMDFKAVFGSVNLTGGLKIDAGLRQGSDDEAKKSVADATAMLDKAKQEAGPFGKYLSKIELSARGSDVIAKVSLSDQELQEIIQAAGPLLGAMMGGGGL